MLNPMRSRFPSRSIRKRHINLKHDLEGILSGCELTQSGLRDGSAQYQLTYRYQPGPFTRLSCTC